jgi:hypothetical protein
MSDSELPAVDLAELRKRVISLNTRFAEMEAKHPDIWEALGPGPELARQFLFLVNRDSVPPEEAKEFADRVRIELKGFKGSPFFALRSLSDRFAELAQM